MPVHKDDMMVTVCAELCRVIEAMAKQAGLTDAGARSWAEECLQNAEATAQALILRPEHQEKMAAIRALFAEPVKH